jgi:hypothetical protein
MRYAIRYKPDTDLGRRFTGLGGSFDSYDQAAALLRFCTNASDMEVIEVDE